MEKPDIKIIQLVKKEFNAYESSQLILELNGKSANAAVVNSLRRLCILYVPTYAFCKELIEIEENKSIFDNDYMKLRLSQLTMPNIKNEISYLPDKFWREIDYADPDRQKLPEDNKILEIYVNIENKNKDLLNVTTDHAKFYENGQELEVFKNMSPLLLIQLRPNENFICRCVAALGIGKRNDIWAAAGNCYLEEIGDIGQDNRYKLTIESQGQMDEYEILYKACKIMKKKIEELKFYISDKYSDSSITKENSLIVRFENEDHTIGNIINEYLQRSDKIAFSGLSRPDLLVDEVIIKIQSINPNPVQPLLEVLDFINELFENIQKQIQKLGNKFIQI